jgi:hypothetical protein
MVNHVDSNPPRSPLSFVGIWQRFLPDRCQANPVGTPGGVSGIWPARGDRFVDPSVNAFHGEVSVNEDRTGTGDWRVEYFDDDGACYITVFAGPKAEQRARDYFQALKFGRLRAVRG